MTSNSFKEKLKTASSLLLVNPRGLGDVIHSLPVAAAIKQAWPHLQIDFLASAHSEGLFDVVPYVRQALSVQHYPRPRSRWQRWGRRLATALAIRRQRYDAIINLQAIDSTMALIALSSARHKLALRSIGTPVRMRWFYSDIVDTRWCNQPAYQFMLEGIRSVGFPPQVCELSPALIDLSAQVLPDGVRAPFFHLSLFASKISRQLPIAEAQSLISTLLQEYPAHQVVTTCSGAPHEVATIHAMIPDGFGDRVQVCAGTLGVAQLCKLLQQADLHIGPDTGSLHVAWLVGAKSVSWCPNHDSMMAWLPYGPQHRILYSVREQVTAGDTESDTRTLRIQKISAALILEQVRELMAASLPPPEQWIGSDQLKLHCLY